MKTSLSPTYVMCSLLSKTLVTVPFVAGMVGYIPDFNVKFFCTLCNVVNYCLVCCFL